MAIRVKSGGGGAALLGSFGAGQGKRTAEDTRQGLDIASRSKEADKHRLFQAQQAAEQRAHQSSESALGRRFSADENAKQRGFAAGESAANRFTQTREREKEREFQREQAVLAEDNWRERLELQQDIRQEDIEWNYTTKQRHDFQRTFDALAEAQASNDFTDDEMQELRQQAYTKLAGLSPLPKLQERSPYPEGQGVGQTWNSPDGQFLLTRDSKGGISKLGELNANPTHRDRLDAYKLAMEASKEDVLNKRGVATGQRINLANARKLVAEMLGPQEESEAVKQWGVGAVGADDGIAEKQEDDEKAKNGKPNSADKWKVRR